MGETPTRWLPINAGEPFDEAGLVEAVGHGDQGREPDQGVPGLTVPGDVSQSTIPVTSIRQMMINTTVVALTTVPPKIQSPRPSTTSMPNITSRHDDAPNSFNWSDAQRITSPP